VFHPARSRTPDGEPGDKSGSVSNCIPGKPLEARKYTIKYISSRTHGGYLMGDQEYYWQRAIMHRKAAASARNMESFRAHMVIVREYERRVFA